MRRILGYFIFLMIMMASQIYAGDIYYVDGTNGYDLNDGLSAETAWRTIAKANSTLQAGDTVYIRAGTYTGSNARIIPSNSGSDGSPITYINYQSDTVILQGTGGDAITLTGKSYITIDAINVDGENPQPSATIDSWVTMGNSSSHHNIIQNCLMEYADAWQAIGISNGAHHNKILNNTLRYCGRSEPPAGDDYGDLLQICNNAHHNLIEGNDITGAGHNLIVLTANGGAYTCNYNIVRLNILHNEYIDADHWHGGRNMSMAPEGGECKYNLVELNIIRDSDQHQNDDYFPNIGMKLACSNSICRRNRIFNNIGNGIMESSGTGQTPQDNKVYNNSFYHNGHGGRTHRAAIGFYEYDGPFGGSAYKNNIFYDNNLGPYQYAGGSQAGDFIFANNHESGDPKFVNAAGGDFNLQGDSPCINNGGFLTLTSGSGSGTAMTVDDAGYFCDGFEMIEGDVIQLYGQGATARIVDVNYSTNVLTLESPGLTWNDNQGVALAYNGSAPDIGAYEYLGTSGAETGGADTGGGGGCFPTVTYGSSFHPYIEILRDFRDKYLMPNKLGRGLVGLYYKYSPFFAEFIAKRKVLKVPVRVILLPFVAFSYSMLHFGSVITAAILAFISIVPIFLILLSRRRFR